MFFLSSTDFVPHEFFAAVDQLHFEKRRIVNEHFQKQPVALPYRQIESVLFFYPFETALVTLFQFAFESVRCVDKHIFRTPLVRHKCYKSVSPVSSKVSLTAHSYGDSPSLNLPPIPIHLSWFSSFSFFVLCIISHLPSFSIWTRVVFLILISKKTGMSKRHTCNQ